VAGADPVSDVVTEYLEVKLEIFRWLENVPLAVRLAKFPMNAARSTDINTRLRVERLAQTSLFCTDDRKEGSAAFLRKRKPSFEGR
jgi:enoyl-CoA hydratase